MKKFKVKPAPYAFSIFFICGFYTPTVSATDTQNHDAINADSIHHNNTIEISALNSSNSIITEQNLQTSNSLK